MTLVNEACHPALSIDSPSSSSSINGKVAKEYTKWLRLRRPFSGPKRTVSRGSLATQRQDMPGQLVDNTFYHEEIALSILKSVPKIELHAHLTGCLRPETVRQLVGSAVDAQAIRNSLQLRSPLVSYSSFFKPWREVLQHIPDTPDVVHRLISEVAKDFAADNVLYAEIRVSPRRPAIAGVLAEYMAAIEDAKNSAYLNQGVELRFILGFARHQLEGMNPSSVMRISDEVLRVSSRHRSTVVGFDVWGDESTSCTFDYTSWFNKIRAEGYPLSLHLGELASADAYERAILSLNPQRVSHGPAISNTPGILKLLESRGILTEVCLTSNWITRGVEQRPGGPLDRLVSAGAPFALCADDTTVLGTTLSAEMGRSLAQGLLSPARLRQSFLSAVDAAFCSQDLRAILRRRLAQPQVDDAFRRLDSLFIRRAA